MVVSTLQVILEIDTNYSVLYININAIYIFYIYSYNHICVRCDKLVILILLSTMCTIRHDPLISSRILLGLTEFAPRLFKTWAEMSLMRNLNLPLLEICSWKITVNRSQQHQGDYNFQNTGFRNLSFQQSLAIVTPNHVLTTAQLFLHSSDQL